MEALGVQVQSCDDDGMVLTMPITDLAKAFDAVKQAITAEVYLSK